MDDKDWVYKASLTREQYLFHEVRTTARLLNEGLSDEDTVKRIVDDNLFQYPTEKSVQRMAKACIRRLRSMNDDSLISAIATQSTETSKQICLYAFMTDYKLVWDFMVTVIGEKYRTLDNHFSKVDVNVYMNKLIEQNPEVAEWTQDTVNKIKQVLIKTLVENEYLDDTKSEELKPVWLNSLLENSIRNSGRLQALHAFNCFD